jgi:hypothetical protein
MTYNIKRTNGTTFSVQPGTVDGPANTTGGFIPATDLNIYGQGTLNWGIGVDQNQVHLLENFSCPSVATTIVSGQQQYRPMTATEVGVTGSGVNQPIIGQEWFNTTNGKLYICYDIGTGTSATALWKTAGADPDLFVPITGGVFTGNVEIVKDSPSLYLTTTNDDGGNASVEFRDNALKGILSLEQTTYPIGALDYPYDLGVPQTVEKPVDFLAIRKHVGAIIVNSMVMRDDYIEFSGGTLGIAGADAGKVRTPATVDADNSLVVATKGWIEESFLSSKVSDISAGNLRIEKENPQLVLEATNTSAVAGLYFDHDNANSGSILSYILGGQSYVDIRKNTGSTTNNRIRLFNTYTEFLQKPRAPATTGGPGFGDTDTTLATKSYVDAVTTTLTSDYLLKAGDSATGIHRFGPAFNDTVITNAILVSTIASGNRTTIAGSNILSELGTANVNVSPGDISVNASATDSTDITGNIVKSINGIHSAQLDAQGLTFITSTNTNKFTQIVDGGASFQESVTVRTAIDGDNILVQNGNTDKINISPNVINLYSATQTQSFNFAMAPGSGNNGNISWFEQAGDPGSSVPAFSNQRASINYEQTTSGSQIDRFQIAKRDTSGNVSTAIALDDDVINVVGDGSTNNHQGMRMFGAASLGGTLAYAFFEGEPYSTFGPVDPVFAQRGGVFYNTQTNEIRLVTESGSAGDLSTSTRTQVNLTRDNGVQSNKRFDFTANIWTQQAEPTINNGGSDRSQRGVDAGSGLIAEARLGDIWMTTGSPPVGFVASSAYIACADLTWKRIAI